VAVGVGRPALDHEGPDVSAVQEGAGSLLLLGPGKHRFRPDVQDDEFRPGEDHAPELLVHQGAAAQGDHLAASLEGARHGGEFVSPEGGFSKGGEYFRHGHPSPFLDHPVGVGEGPSEPPGEFASHARFSRAHEPADENVVPSCVMKACTHGDSTFQRVFCKPRTVPSGPASGRFRTAPPPWTPRPMPSWPRPPRWPPGPRIRRSARRGPPRVFRTPC